MNIWPFRNKREIYKKLEWKDLVKEGRRRGVLIPDNGVIKGVDYYKGNITPQNKIINGLLEKDKDNARQIGFVLKTLAAIIGVIASIVGIISGVIPLFKNYGQ